MQHLVQNSPRNVRDLFNLKDKINTLQEDNTNVSNNYSKANFLKDYFHSIFTEENLDTLLSLDPSLWCPNLNQIIVISLSVQKLLESLNVDKANGPDGVPTYILRPISISFTSVTSKILQHIICHHIWNHLEDHNVLSNFQHGFCKRRNGETQLIMAIHDLISAVNSKKQVDAFILDFSKAFDRVAHQGCSIS